MKKIILLFFLGISCSYGISDDNKISKISSYKNVYKIYPRKNYQTNLTKFSEVFSSVKIIELKEKENALIGEIDKIICKDSLIYILDRNFARGVVVFNMQGKFMRKFGKIGKGPKQYIHISDFCIYDNELCILCNNNNVIFYNLNTNKFIKKIKAGNDNANFIGRGEDYILLDSEKSKVFPKRYKHACSVYNLRGKLTYNYLNNFESNNRINSISIIQDCKFKTPMTTNGVYFINTYGNIIYKVGRDSIYPYIEFNTPRFVKPGKVKYKKMYNVIKPDFGNKIEHSISGFNENSRIIHFNWKSKGNFYHLFYDKNLRKIIYSGNGMNPDLLVNNNKHKVWAKFYYMDNNIAISETIYPLYKYDINKHEKIINSLDFKDNNAKRKFLNFNHKILIYKFK